MCMCRGRERERERERASESESQTERERETQERCSRTLGTGKHAFAHITLASPGSYSVDPFFWPMLSMSSANLF